MRTPRVAIVGAGISGICLAVLMKKAGFNSFTIYEKADDVGGVWRDNRYPGLHCDIPTRGYSFTFAPKHDWARMYSTGPEIYDYLREVADKFAIRQHIRFGAEVSSARWTGQAWEVTDADGRVDEYDFLISAIGLLHIPNVPAIAGLESFEGDICHTAQWREIDLKGRRVAVVGTGSSGVQIVGAIADQVSELVQISRTPQWILPAFNVSHTRLNKFIMRHSPLANRLAHRFTVWIFETLSLAMLKPGFMRITQNFLSKMHLRTIRDPELREALTPEIPMGCKRPVQSGTYYKAIQRPNVRYVVAGVESIDATGLTTTDGIRHEVDVIILATGFKFATPLHQVRGDHGQLLEEVWAQAPKNYRAVAVAGFPNHFLVNGPPTAQTSLCWSAEVYGRYVVRWLELYRDGKVDRATVSQEAQDRFQAMLAEVHPTTSYTAGCQSYYLSADGTPMVLAMLFRDLAEMLREPDLSDYVPVNAKPEWARADDGGVSDAHPIAVD